MSSSGSNADSVTSPPLNPPEAVLTPPTPLPGRAETPPTPQLFREGEYSRLAPGSAGSRSDTPEPSSGGDSGPSRQPVVTTQSPQTDPLTDPDKTHSDHIREGLRLVGKGVKGAVVGGVTSAANAAKAGAVGAKDAMVGGATSAAKAARTGAVSAKNAVVGGVTSAAQAAKAGAVSAKDVVVGGVTSAAQAAKAGAVSAKDAVVGGVTSAAKAARTGAVSAKNAVVGGVTSAAQAAKAGAVSAKDAMVGGATSAARAVGNGAVSAKQGVARRVGWAASSVAQGPLGQAAGSTKQAVGALATGVASSARNGISSLRAWGSKKSDSGNVNVGYEGSNIVLTHTDGRSISIPHTGDEGRNVKISTGRNGSIVVEHPQSGLKATFHNSPGKLTVSSTKPISVTHQ